MKLDNNIINLVVKTSEDAKNDLIDILEKKAIVGAEIPAELFDASPYIVMKVINGTYENSKVLFDIEKDDLNVLVNIMTSLASPYVVLSYESDNVQFIAQLKAFQLKSGGKSEPLFTKLFPMVRYGDYTPKLYDSPEVPVIVDLPNNKERLMVLKNVPVYDSKEFATTGIKREIEFDYLTK